MVRLVGGMENGGLRSCLELQFSQRRGGVCARRRTKARPSLIPSIHRPSSNISLTATTTISLCASLPPSNLTSLQLVSYYNCLFSPTHTFTEKATLPLQPPRLARLEAPASKFDAPVSRLPSPVRRRHLPTATSACNNDKPPRPRHRHHPSPTRSPPRTHRALTNYSLRPPPTSDTLA
jgi:hypothetical protein